ncbi:MAG: T9SS type A sorting domain-containing protein [Candidatus Cloacimonetes bacterium]|nr:T9SS type A sorting domain-containing protein [Candidatus Cloacimonadota bacterium]
MKKYLLFFIVFILSCILTTLLFANYFTIEKINEFAFAQSFNYSEETIIIEYPYLYALTSHGLEIYEIQNNGQLQQLSILPITSPYRFVLQNNFVYIINAINYGEYSFYPLCLYQIDIIDKENPYIYNQIEFEDPISTFQIQIFNNYLYLLSLSIPDKIYTIPELELFTTIPDSIDIWKICDNDKIGVNKVYASLMDIYDVTDLTNIQLIGTIDMNPIHGSCVPRYFEMLNDSVLIAGGQTAISFWNISDNANWEYISHYEPGDYTIYGKNFTIIGNYLVLTRFDGLELVDISDIHNPQFADYLFYYPAEASAAYNENLYVATRLDGIQRYQVPNGQINFIENIFEYPAFRSGYIYLNYLFIQTYRYGILLFDISNPNEPVEIPTILSNPDFKILQGYENLIVVQDYSDYSYKIFDISEPLNPILTNTILIGDWLQIGLSYLRFDDADPNIVYFFTVYPNTIIRKYDISEPGIPVLLFEYTDLDGDSFFVRNGYGYMLSDINNYQNLYILDGLYENSPYIVNTIDHFSEYEYSPVIQLCSEYLYMRNSYEETKFFNLDNPIIPLFEFDLEVPSNSGQLFTFDNFIFTKTSVSSYIYDISGNPSGILEPIDSIYGLTYICSIDFYESDENNYLFIIEESDIGVFEFSYTHSVDDEILNNEKINLNNYPNPFRTSTTISFFNTKPSKNTKIKIYNVKGQLVKTLLPFTPVWSQASYGAGTHNSPLISVIWNGKDENDKQVPNGIYLCKLSIGKETIVRKMVLLR